MSSLPPGAYSAIMAAAGAGAFGLTLYIAARAAGILSTPLLYHSFVFGAFFGLYMVMPGGFDKHFNIPEKKTMSVADVAYYSMVVHSTAGFGDIYPISFWSRSVVATHLGLVFLGTAGLIPLGK